MLFLSTLGFYGFGAPFYGKAKVLKSSVTKRTYL